MPHGKRPFNSSSSNKTWTFDENLVEKRIPRPSKVNYRFELAREKPVADNPKVERLLYYKNLLAQSNASTQEMKTLEDLIESLEDKNATKKGEVEEQGEKYLGGYNMLMNALNLSAESVEPNKDPDIAESELEKCFTKLGVSTESSSQELFAADTASAVAVRQTYMHKKFGYPNHLERIITTSVLKDKSQDDNSDRMESSASDGGDLLDHLHIYKIANTNNDFDELSSLNEKKATECICRRGFRKTRCMSCNEEMNGRTLRRCDYHGKVVFSEDYFFCIKCCADIPQQCDIGDA